MPLEADSFRCIPGFEDFQTRSTDVAELSGGTVGVKLVRRTPGSDRVASMSTPWHMHDLRAHVGYVIKGWGIFEFEGLGRVRLEAGMVFFQPVRNRHRELDTSPDFEAIEIVMPAAYESTVFVYDEGSREYRAQVVPSGSAAGTDTSPAAAG